MQTARSCVGATSEEKGFDTRLTVEGTGDLLADARELLPRVSEIELVEASVGLRPGSPDNAPMIGAGALPGLVVATGHYRNGILLAPVTADAVVELLTTGALPAGFDRFDPCRFARADGTGMTIVINGQRHELPDDATLTDVVARLTRAARGVAVALNGSVVPRGEWQSTALAEADQVEILTAVQGG